MNEISCKPAHTVAELASARQHQESPAGHHGARSGHANTKWRCTKFDDSRCTRKVTKLLAEPLGDAVSYKTAEMKN